jgi:hypothetical protein
MNTLEQWVSTTSTRDKRPPYVEGSLKKDATSFEASCNRFEFASNSIAGFRPKTSTELSAVSSDEA